MKILFHENELNYRGTSIAMYDYADFNERILGNESIIIYNKNCKTNHPLGIEKFKKRFEVLEYEALSELDNIITKNNVDLLYAIKNGDQDGVASTECKTAVHAVFKHCDPHGNVYAYVSEWLAQEMSGGIYPFVPHMVNFEAETKEDLRTELNISRNAKVFGYYGGAQSFNIPFAQKTVEQIAHKYKDIYFLFMGVDPFIKPKWWKSKLKNIIFLPPNADINRKLKFINTCSALLHARERGETFGITVAEFVLQNKPVITFADSPEKAHLMELGNDAYLYRNKNELKEILLDTDLSKTAIRSYEKFLPQQVMEQFKKVFI